MYWLDHTTCNDIPDNINNNTGVGLAILGWTSMKFVV